jgi:hypothetical protein
MKNLTLGVRVVFIKVVTGIVTGIFHPNVMTALAFAALVWAAYRTWGLTGALWMFAAVALTLAMASASSPS